MSEILGLSDIRIIPNGIDFRKFPFAEKKIAMDQLGWGSENRHILFSSDPDRTEKNYKLFQEAVNLLIPRFPNLEVHFLKGIPRERVYLYYNASDVLILTSLFEGSPNVIKEAMACNCPIIATDVGDVKELINSTDGCFITGFSPWR